MRRFLSDLRRDVWATGSLRWGLRSAVADARLRAEARAREAASYDPAGVGRMG